MQNALGARVGPAALSVAVALLAVPFTVPPANASAAGPNTVVTWGYGGSGQLGNGTMPPSGATGPVTADTGHLLTGKALSSLSNSADNTCLVADATVYCWGSAAYGLLGQGHIDHSAVPVAIDTTGVFTGKTVTAVSIGRTHACALASGQLYCWGNNERGQLGIGTTSSTPNPVPTAVDTTGALMGRTVTQVVTGNMLTCAVASGAAYCWGHGTYGEFGQGPTVGDVYVPQAVVASGALLGKTVTQIATTQVGTDTYYGLPDFVCAVADARAYCWGDNQYGQTGSTSVGTAVPTLVGSTGPMAGLDVTTVTLGTQHACAVAASHVYCWGRNFSGQLGTGTTTPDFSPNPEIPVAVTATSDLGTIPVSALGADSQGTCALAAGNLYCWGNTYLGGQASPTLAATTGQVDAGQITSFTMSLSGGALLGTKTPPPPAATAQSMRASTELVTFGGSVTLSGLLLTTAGADPVPGQIVTIRCRTSSTGPWVALGHATSSASGTWTLTLKPTVSRQYDAVSTATATYASSTSSTIGVSVRPTVTQALSRTHVRRGTTVYFSGKVTPTARGQLTCLQRYVGRHWTTVATARLTATGTYRIALKTKSTVDYTYRTYVPAHAGYAVGLSLPHKLYIS